MKKMRKTLQIFAIVLLMGNKVNAQVPNGGFENWSGTEANAWVSTNGLTFLGNPQSVYKSTDAHSGSFACEINTIHVTNKPQGAGIPDYTGSIFLGKLVNFNPIMGASNKYRPDKLVFWHKYIPKGTDSAVALFTLTRWNTTTNKTDTVGLGIAIITDSTSTYKKTEINVNYFDSKVPDTILVLFVSSTITANKAGSKLIIDDVDITGGNTGIIVKEITELEIYPNPAKHLINLNLTNTNIDKNVMITITDMHGKNIYIKEHIGGSLSTIQTSTYTPGVYIINIIGDEKVLAKKIIIE